MYPYKGINAPTKIAMKILSVGAQGPKWNLKVHRLSIHALLSQFCLLAKIVLANLWPISRHTKMPLDHAQFMYTLATGVDIDFSRHIIDVIHKAHIENELNLPFGSIITTLAMKAMTPLRKNELNLKITNPISVIKIVKSEYILTKKRSHTTEFALSPLEPLVPMPQVLEQINLISHKVDSMNAKWETLFEKHG